MEALGLLADASELLPRTGREVLEGWLAEHEQATPKVKIELEAYTRSLILEAPVPVAEQLGLVRDILVSGANSRAADWHQVVHWMQQREVASTANASRWVARPSVRRGLSKLLVFGDALAGLRPNGRISDALGVQFGKFEWAKRSIAGWRIVDEELAGVLAGFQQGELLELLPRITTDEFRVICADVASSTWLAATSEFFIAAADRLASATEVESLLNTWRQDPDNVPISAVRPEGLSGNWIFRVLMALIKKATGLKQGYGYEQFIGDIRTLARDQGLPESLAELGATLPKLLRAGSTDSLRRRLVDWVSGLSEASLEPWEIRLAAIVLANRCRLSTEVQLQAAAAGLPDFIRRTTYEDRIAPYRYFEPLRALIELKLEEAGIEYEYAPRHPTLVSEGSISARSPGTTPVIKVGGTLIHWKSAHGSHTGDKSKELYGRAFALRHRLLPGSLTPTLEVAIQQLCLVLDGDFTEDQVRHLTLAGWDHVFGPYDLDRLISALQ